MKPAVELPCNKHIHIAGRANFPALDLEYVPDVFGAEQVAWYETRFDQIEYVSRIGDPNPENLYAWFCDKGEWLYSIDAAQHNAFVPYAFPGWLRAIMHSIVTRVESLIGTAGWNACLVTRVQARDGKALSQRLSKNADIWHCKSSSVVDAVFSASSPIQITVKPCQSSTAMTPISISIPAGSGAACIVTPVAPDNASSGNTLLWDYEFSTNGGGGDEAVFYHVSLRNIHPLSVDAQYRMRYPARKKAARRIVPLLDGGKRERDDEQQQQDEEDNEELDAILRQVAASKSTTAVTPAPKKKKTTTAKKSTGTK